MPEQDNNQNAQDQDNQSNKYADMEIIPGINYEELGLKLKALSLAKRETPPKTKAEEMSIILKHLTPTEITFLYTNTNAEYNKVTHELSTIKGVIADALIMREEIMAAQEQEEKPGLLLPNNGIIT